MTHIALSHSPDHHTAWAIWTRWTAITSVGEFVGFAIPAVVGAVAATRFGNTNTLDANVIMAVVMTLSGACEGALLGLAQWYALRHYLPGLRLRDWAGATAAGAAVAWAIGMLPSTYGDPSTLPRIVLILGALTLGPTLLCSIGFAQYWILKRYLHHAGWWMPASAVAWLLGLAVVFVGMALIPDNATVSLIILLSSLAGFGMGAVAAGISGVALVWLLRQEAHP